MDFMKGQPKPCVVLYYLTCFNISVTGKFTKYITISHRYLEHAYFTKLPKFQM